MLAGPPAVPPASAPRSSRSAAGPRRSPPRSRRAGPATPCWSPARVTRPVRRSPASCIPSTTASCCAGPRRRGAAAMIALTLGEIADIVGGRLRRRRPGHARHRRRRVRLAPGRTRRPVPRARRASASTATTSRRGGRRRARWPCLVDPPRRCPERSRSATARRARPPWRGAGRPAAARAHRRRHHRILRQDLHEGPARGDADERRARPSPRPARSTTSSATPTPCCAPTATPGSWCWRWARAASATSATSARSPPPRIGVVLNVGSAHLGEFGSREAIAQAKGELVEALPRRTAASPCSTPTTRSLRRWPAANARPRGHGRPSAPTADVRADDVRARRPAAGLGFTLHRGRRRARRSHCVWCGEHHVANALAAAAVALECGLPVAAVAAALPSAEPASSRWRMEVTERRRRRA